ncbi:MAG: ATP-binding cassette domain-containing protein [Pseudomonadota bacterium]
MTETPKIRLRGVHKAFGPKTVLNGVDLVAEKSKSLVIIGGSGTGKSVLLKCVLGLLTPDRGSIDIDGKSVVGLTGAAKTKHLEHIGMLFQGGALFDSLPVWRNVAFGLIEGQGMAKAEAKHEAIENLRRVGLTPDVAELSPAELSGGMQKRVSLARAIATRPDIIFFDEPTTGLDPIMADVINDLIVDRVKALGATAVTITHDMASARKIADHVAMIFKGQIIWHGPVGDIDSSGNAHVEQFINGRAEGPIEMEILKA